MPEIQIPHRIVYDVPNAANIADVIESLVGTQRLLFEVGPLLEGLLPGLTIDRVEIHIQEISQQSPLKEVFWIALAATFQKDLEAEVPKLVDELFGTHTAGSYDTIVTVLFLLIFYYGVEFLISQIKKRIPDSKVRRQLNGLVAEVAQRCGLEEADVRRTLENRYQKTGIKRLAGNAMRVVMPSKRQGSAPIIIGDRTVPRESIEEIPADANIQEYEDEETSLPVQNVEIEIHAQDVDRSKRGWAGVLKGISPKRLRMEIFPPIKPEQIYTRQVVRGDVLVVSRRGSNGEFEPYMFHLIGMRD